MEVFKGSSSPVARPCLVACALAALACAPEGVVARGSAATPAPAPRATGAPATAMPSGAAPTVTRSAGPAPAEAPSVAPTGAPGAAPTASAPDEPATTPDEAATAPDEPAALLTAAPAASPVPVTLTYTDETAWADELRAAFPARAVAGPAALDLNREAATPITRARGFNVPASHGPVGFAWNDGDREVEEWMPQGLGGFVRDGRRWLVVAWYAKDLVEDTSEPAEAKSYRGARISLVDVTDPAKVRYRHALLVQDAANAGQKDLFRMRAPAKAGYTQGARFAPVPVHAGGAEVWGHLLYVVDTQLGVRVFDLDRLLATDADPAKATCGVVDGKAIAFDYRYVVPQIGRYRVVGAAPYSCLALDPGAMTLWLGQYLAPDADQVPAVTGVPLGADGKLADRAVAKFVPRDKGGGAAYRVQGAFKRGDVTWMAITGQTLYERSTARLLAYRDGAPAGSRWRWPHGAEDLYYEADRDMLWCLTEHPKAFWSLHDRVVFGVRLATYQPPIP